MSFFQDFLQNVGKPQAPKPQPQPVQDNGFGFDDVLDFGKKLIKNTPVSPFTPKINFGTLKQGLPKVGTQIANAPFPIAGNHAVKNKDVANFAHEAFIKSPARFGTSLYLDKMKQPGYVAQGPAQKFLLGDEYFKSFSGQEADLSKKAQEFGVSKGVADNFAGPALFGVGLLDFTGAGKSKIAASKAIQLAKQFDNVDDFRHALGSVDNETKSLLDGIFTDPKNPIRTVDDFFETVRTGKAPTGAGSAEIPDVKLLGQGDPEQRAIEAVQNMQPLRKEQEALYTAERAKRIQAALKAEEEAGGGVEGFKAKMNQMSGAMQKVDAPSISSQVSKSDIDFLVDKIKSSPALTEFEKIPAQKALLALFDEAGAAIPRQNELDKLRKVFNPKLIDALLDQRPMGQKVKDAVVDVLNVPRSLMSSGDFSAPLRQGVIPAATHPRDFVRSVKNMFKYAFSQKEYDNFYKEIQSRSTYPLMVDHKLAITDMGSHATREEAFMSNLAEKIPGIGKIVRASDRAYTGFLNNFRADLFDTLYANGKHLGKGNDEKYLDDLADFINTATGRGDLKKVPLIGEQLSEAAPLLNASFFSPRLIASRVSMLNPVYYAKMSPPVRNEALKTMAIFLGTGLTILGAFKLAGAEVEEDPTSADFGKIKYGNTRYDIWGGFQPYAVLMARMLTGEYTSTTTGKKYKYGEGYKPQTRKDALYRFGETKASPIASFGVEALQGQDFERNEFDITNPNLMENPISKRLMPIMASDFKDKYEEYGAVGPVLSIPGLFGVGTATYSPKVPFKKR